MSALHPAGPHAEQIARLWNVFLAVSVVVYALVIAALLLALIRGRRKTKAGGVTATAAVSMATGATVLILIGLLAASIVAGRGVAAVPRSSMHVLVTGRQWWWQVEYEDPDPSRRITSANEINVPVGVPVILRLHSSDVIHSFWVPSLNGKRDLIPGRDGEIAIEASRPGLFRGQCAELCGVQHAKMALWVNALSAADYARWADSARQPAPPPATPRQWKGQAIFLRSPCPLCHNVAGTDAGGKTGPDLTHFASRRSIAAGSLPNTRQNLALWILDPQRVKPGSQMPPTPLQEPDLEELLDYLESLR
jgi:cytochrome c oxidase subunit 2